MPLAVPRSRPRLPSRRTRPHTQPMASGWCSLSQWRGLGQRMAPRHRMEHGIDPCQRIPVPVDPVTHSPLAIVPTLYHRLLCHRNHCHQRPLYHDIYHHQGPLCHHIYHHKGPLCHIYHHQGPLCHHNHHPSSKPTTRPATSPSRQVMVCPPNSTIPSTP